MREWRRVRLADVADEVTVGYVGTMANEYMADGVPFLRSLNVRPHRIDIRDLMHVDREFHGRLKKSSLRPGDVVTVRTGKPGQTAVIPEWLPEANCSDLVITRPGPDLDARWLSYYFNWITDSHIAGHLVGAVQQHFNVKSAQSLVLDLPPLIEQRAIGEVMGALDDKIAANDRVIERADELARLHFLAAAGGGQVPLSALARFVNGKAFTKDATGTGRVVVRIAELNSGIGGSTVYNDIDVADDHLARPGDLLFAWSGSLTTARWYRPEAIVNQHIFKVIPTAGAPIWLVNQAVHAKLDEFKGIAADKATTMGHIQRRHLDQVVAVPTDDEAKRIDGLMAGLWETALAVEIESLGLIRTRDELLPLLMSGKARVRDVEQVVEESPHGQ
jgi:type I restriction enzyme, S subunit